MRHGRENKFHFYLNISGISNEENKTRIIHYYLQGIRCNRFMDIFTANKRNVQSGKQVRL